MNQTTPPSSEYISLKEGPNGGLDVPMAALALALELENRGCTLQQDGEKLRIKGPNGAKPELSSSDIERITRWKTHLLALRAYQPPEVM